MLNPLNKYRHFLLGILITSYALSVFQKPLFEAMHLFSHLPQIVFSGKDFHSFQSHHEESHQHQILSKLKVHSAEDANVPPAQQEQELKKKIELVNFTSNNAVLNTQRSHPNFQFLLPSNSIFFKIQVPPPQLFT